MTFSEPAYLVEHDVPDSTIGSLDVKETKSMICQRLLNVLNVG